MYCTKCGEKRESRGYRFCGKCGNEDAWDLSGARVAPLKDLAEELVEVAHSNAVAMFETQVKRFPFLQDAEMVRWEFCVTIAGVFMAISELNIINIEENNKKDLRGTVTIKLEQWSPHALRGFANFSQFFEEEYKLFKNAGDEEQFLTSNFLGKWIIFKVFGELPKTGKKLKLAHATGKEVEHKFINYWGTEYIPLSTKIMSWFDFLFNLGITLTLVWAFFSCVYSVFASPPKAFEGTVWEVLLIGGVGWCVMFFIEKVKDSYWKLR